MSVRSARRQPLTSPLLDDASTVQTMDTEQERELLFTPAALTQKMSGLRRVGERAAPVAGSVAAFAFTLNYIFGAGVLSLPHTVANAGVIGCAVFMIFTSLVSAVSMIWLTEVCGRAEALTRCAEERASSKSRWRPLWKAAPASSRVRRLTARCSSWRRTASTGPRWCTRAI